VCMGTRFLLTRESPMHADLKARMVAAAETETTLVGRRFGDSIRVLRNATAAQVLALEAQASTTHADLHPLIAAARWMSAMETGIDDAAFPLGQCVGLIEDLPTCGEYIDRLMTEARSLVSHRLASLLSN
jgi:NAD(P)H-dependent flavin oxidoreductase YrpB (nitropropane dioxygenase family)